MKRVLSIALVSAVAAGIFGASNMVNADTTDTSTSTNTDTTASTNGSVTFTAGTLKLSNVTTDAKFTGASVQDVYTKGLIQTADNQMTATVSDFLGAANDEWSLTVAKGGWSKGTGSASTPDATLDENAKLSIGGTEVTTAGLEVLRGGAGQQDMTAADLTLNINKGTNVTADTYTNTLTWTLADPADPKQN